MEEPAREAAIPLAFRLQYAAIVLISGLGRLLPRPGWLTCGRALGSLVYTLHGRHRRRTLRNLEQAFHGTLSTAEISRIARGSFRHVGALLFESLTLPWRSAQTIESLVDLEGVENYQRAKNQGRGVIILTGHFGNWEIHALRHALAFGPGYVVGRAPDNPYLKRRMERIRTLSGNRIIYKEGALRQMRRALRGGDTVAFLIDQNIRSGDRVFVDFFGRKAATTRLPAWFAVKHGVQLVPVSCLPTADGRYRAVYEPALDLTEFAGLPREDATLAITQRCTTIFERQVREHPECWMWMQRRWSSRPPEELIAAATVAKMETDHG